MINISVLMGRLTTDPELRSTNNGTAVTRFSVAVDKRGRAGEERQANFINVVAWRQTAEFVCKYFRKGSMIAVRGPIDTNRYEDRDGNKRTSFEIIADEVSFCGSKAEGNNNVDNRQQGKQAPQNARNSARNNTQNTRQARSNNSNVDYSVPYDEPPYDEPPYPYYD